VPVPAAVPFLAALPPRFAVPFLAAARAFLARADFEAVIRASPPVV
jgi:hypothetical protein